MLTPGESFGKTWKFQNTGSGRWSSDFSLVFVQGDEMDGSSTTIDEVVIPNKRVDVSVRLTAPDDEGTYTGYRQLEDSYYQYAHCKSYSRASVPTATSISISATVTPVATGISTDMPTAIPATATNSPVPEASPTETCGA